MSDKKDKSKKDKKFKNKCKIQSQYDQLDDDSDRELSTEDIRTKTHKDIPDQFKQYIDEMHEYYQKQQAYLQEQNANCFQQLFQIVCQGQQKPKIMPQLPGGYMPPYCVPQGPQPYRASFSRYYPLTGYNPDPQRYPQHLPPQTPTPPPRPFNDVLYEDVVDGTRVTVSESPWTPGHSPHLAKPLNLPSSSHHSQRDRSKRAAVNANEARQKLSVSGGESMPQVNLFITVTPHVQPTTEYAPPQQQLPPQVPVPKLSHIPEGQHKEETSKYGLEDLGGEREDVLYGMHRRRSVRDALRERMKDRDRFRSYRD